MRKRAATTLALATLIALVLTGYAATSRAQDGQRTITLSPGCNMVTLSFAGGTQTASVAAAVSPPTALQAIWRLDNATRSFQAFMPQAPQASDLTSVNLLDAVFMCVDGAAAIAMPSVSPDAAGAPISVNLSTGCNAVGLTFLDGSDPPAVATAVTPAGALQSIWRLDNVTHAFQAFVAAAPQASDLGSLQFLDAAFVCTGGPATLSMPAVTQPAAVAAPPATPTGGGTETVRYLMEGAVPQAVDLPQSFVAVGEDFQSFDPPGLLYYYIISYGDPLALMTGSLGTPFFVEFDLALFDKVADAQSVMQGMRSLSEAEMQGELWDEIGAPTGLDVDSLTIEKIEPVAGIGEEASFIRLRLYARPAGSTTLFMPIGMDIFAIRRDRVVGEVVLIWTPGPPGQQFVTENLAKKMDAGIQAALPQLQAAVP
jgi:hypothetical protein